MTCECRLMFVMSAEQRDVVLSVSSPQSSAVFRRGMEILVDFLSLPSFLLCEGTHLKNENKEIVPVLFLKLFQMLFVKLRVHCEERSADGRRVMDESKLSGAL
ncbi:hypothetical protein IRJ41_024282 [Triplophysa rosa]|uniref:Uncharacterized protein n=1 Tax=Triplophysa rosa TaxID=992332 RepID=A0A9W7TLS3_TRIRA|nr:hypothetical protein IRJ41_024282 [Triplophysa rosa]